jgi:hypothetical protein
VRRLHESWTTRFSRDGGGRSSGTILIEFSGRIQGRKQTLKSVSNKLCIEDKKTLLMYQLALFNAVNARIEGAFMEVPRPSFRPK